MIFFSQCITSGLKLNFGFRVRFRIYNPNPSKSTIQRQRSAGDQHLQWQVPSSNSGFLVVRTNKSFRPLWRNKKRNQSETNPMTGGNSDFFPKLRASSSSQWYLKCFKYCTLLAVVAFTSKCAKSQIFVCAEKNREFHFKCIKETERYQSFYVPRASQAETWFYLKTKSQTAV